MSIVRLVKGGGQIFYCPGCDGYHQLNTTAIRWTFNGDLERPTFTPSILSRMTMRGQAEEICHSFVTNGRIQYLADCTHALAGQAIDLPQWPHAPGEFGGLDEDGQVRLD